MPGSVTCGFPSQKGDDFLVFILWMFLFNSPAGFEFPFLLCEFTLNDPGVCGHSFCSYLRKKNTGKHIDQELSPPKTMCPANHPVQ